MIPFVTSGRRLTSEEESIESILLVVDDDPINPKCVKVRVDFIERILQGVKS